MKNYANRIISENMKIKIYYYISEPKHLRPKIRLNIDKDKCKIIKYMCKQIQRMDFQVDDFFLTNRK